MHECTCGESSECLRREGAGGGECPVGRCPSLRVPRVASHLLITFPEFLRQPSARTYMAGCLDTAFGSSSCGAVACERHTQTHTHTRTDTHTQRVSAWLNAIASGHALLHVMPPNA